MSRVNHWITKAGDRRRISWTYSGLFDGAGTVTALIATGVDVTDEHRAQVERRRAERRFRIAFDHAPDGIALLDAEGRILDGNTVLAGYVDQTSDDLVGQAALDLLDAPEGTSLTASGQWQQLVAGRRQNDERILLHRITLLEDADDSEAQLLLESTDITSEVHDRQRLAWQATHDALTGLANRAALLDRLTASIAGPIDAELGEAPNQAVLLIDLDGFKAVNDSLGHHAGDAVLVEVATRLSDLARSDDVVARLGGDEFVVVATDVDLTGAEAIARRIEASLSTPIRVGDATASIGASVGIRLVDASNTAEVILMEADMEMYTAKRERRVAAKGGRGSVPAAIPANEAERLALLHSLDLLDHGEDPTLQAIARLAAQVCGTPMAAVTLIDASRQCIVAHTGIGGGETSRDDAFCAHTILDQDVMVVADANHDDRFSTNPFVLGEPHVRFYAGAPLQIVPGTSVGALCVLDDQPRELLPHQREALQDLSELLVGHITRGRLLARLA